MGLFQQGIDAGQRVKDSEQLVGWKNAIERVLQSSQPGELWLIQADTIDETVEYMKSLKVSNSVLREVSLKAVLESPSMPAPAPVPASQMSLKN